jgi:hypothetical protein
MSKGNRASGTHELGVESMQMASFFLSSDPHSVLAPTSVERHVPLMKAHPDFPGRFDFQIHTKNCATLILGVGIVKIACNNHLELIKIRFSM